MLNHFFILLPKVAQKRFPWPIYHYYITSHPFGPLVPQEATIYFPGHSVPQTSLTTSYYFSQLFHARFSFMYIPLSFETDILQLHELGLPTRSRVCAEVFVIVYLPNSSSTSSKANVPSPQLDLKLSPWGGGYP
ncbi:unnamed protein product [Ectocarpus sp. 4 AP-2014]